MRRLLHLARRAFRGTLGDQGGVALVLTLLVVVLLTAMILDADYRTRLDVRSAANFRDDTRAYLLASSAVAAARVVLQESRGKRASADWNGDLWGQPLRDIPVGDGTVSIQVTDEGGKMDVNTLIAIGTDPQEPDMPRVDAYRRLLEDLFQDDDQVDVDELVDSLLDWLDTDEQPRPHGDETPYYASLENPYACRNGQLRGFDELGLVKGYTPEVLTRLAPHVTALWLPGTTDQTKLSWQPAVNINDASEEVLAALDPQIADGVGGILADRKEQPFESCTDVGRVVKLLADELQRICPKLVTMTSDFYSVEASGTVGDTVREVRATLYRRGAKTDVIAWRSAAE